MLHNRHLPHLIAGSPLVAAVAAAAVVLYFPQHIDWALGASAFLVGFCYVLSRICRRRALLRFVQVFDDTPAGLLLLDLDGNVAWGNRVIETIGERPREAFIGQPLSELLAGEAWDKVQSQRRELLAGSQVDLDGYITTASGRTVCAHANLLRSQSGKPEYIILQVLDLSATRDAQSAESVSEARLYRTLDLSTDMIINTDHSGRITYANAAAVDLLSASDQRLEGRSILDYVAPDEHRRFLTAFKKCQVNAGRPTEFSRLTLRLGDRTSPRPHLRRVSASMTGIGDEENAIALVCKDTHEQMAYLEQLRSSEARFSRIFHTSPDAILIVRKSDSLILDCNAGFSRLLGYTREDAIGCRETDLELFPDPSERRSVIRELDRNSEATGLKTRLRNKSGQLIDVELALRYAEIDGEVCTLCIGRDISKRVKAEADLKASEEKFQQVFRRSPDGILILKQKDLSIYEVNDAFLLAAQYSREELVGRTVYEFNVFEEDGALEAATEALSTHGYFQNREMAFHTKHGLRVQALVSATYVQINDEPCILCIAKNINELRQAENKLRESEQRFRSAFENSPIGIVLIDLNGKIFQANNFAAEVLGYDKTPLNDQQISRLVPAQDRAQLKEMLERLVSGREETLRRECRMLRADGLEIWTNLHVVAQRDAAGKPDHLIGQIADITEMKSSQSRMERMAFYSVFIFLSSGETLVSHTSPMVKLEQTLLTGLLTAIREFGHEAIAEEIRTIGAGEYRFHYDVYDKTSSSALITQPEETDPADAPIGLITVGLADGNADELEVQAVLHSLNVLFYAQYEPLLKKWSGDVKPFQTFLPIINDALEAHNQRSSVAKRRISSAEHVLAVFEDTLDVVLLNILVGNAIIITGVKKKKFEELSEAIDNVLPFTVPNMPGISDLETAQGILQSREDQQRKRPTLLGVTEKIYRSLTTPENLEHYLFVNLTKKSPVYIAPFNQPSMDLAKLALDHAKDDSLLQAKLLELQLDNLRAQLTNFIEFRRSAQHFTLEHLRTLLHLDSERFRLLTYLSQESILVHSTDPETEPPRPEDSD